MRQRLTVIRTVVMMLAATAMAHHAAAQCESWFPLGSGIGGENSFRSLTVYKGSLIAGGRFTTVGGHSANNIARWNGSEWQPLGSGITGYAGYVFALTAYH